MTQIQISSEDVMAYSKQVDAYANEIRTVFNEIESKMYYVESIWQSPASKYFMEQFQTLNPAMMSYLETLTRFSTYLHQTACIMDEIQFYKVLSSDLSSLLNQTKNAVSSEEFVYVNQKVSRIQYLIQIQIQEILNHESR